MFYSKGVLESGCLELGCFRVKVFKGFKRVRVFRVGVF